SRPQRAPRPGDRREPGGAVRAVLLPRVPDRPSVHARDQRRGRRAAGRRAARREGMTPLSILHLAANRWWTGSADPVIQLVAGLRARGHRVLLGIIPGDRFEAKAREAGIEVVDGLRLDARPGPRTLVRATLRLRAIIRDEGVDVVHT